MTKLVWGLVLLLVSGVAALVLIPNFIRTNCGGTLTACKSNLKNLGTGMEMYATDWEGHYPRNLALLTPNYLKTIPECPEARRVTYRMSQGVKAPYNTQSYEDYYLMECVGTSHLPVMVPINYPQYNGTVGLIER